MMGNKPSRSGLKGLIKAVNARGLSGIDRRLSASRAVMAWRADLLNDLGGEDNCSTQQKTIVELASRSVLFLNHIDAFLLETPSLINRKAKKILPILLQRQTLCDSLLRQLTALGLQRQAKRLPTLAEYLEQTPDESPSPCDADAAGNVQNDAAGESVKQDQSDDAPSQQSDEGQTP